MNSYDLAVDDVPQLVEEFFSHNQLEEVSGTEWS